jgi:hypothetical protein
MDFSRVYISTSVPEESINDILAAISSAGGGIVGHYTHCAFTSAGVGRFMPDSDAQPYLGAKQTINIVDEWRIETFCDRSVAKAVVAAIRAAHPYEETIIYVLPMLDEADL